MTEEKTKHRNAILRFGELDATIVAKDIPTAVRILGFIPADRAMEFTSMNPVYIVSGDYLPALAMSMATNSLDAVVFGGKDMILRAESVSGPDELEKRYILFLCFPAKPLFDQDSPRFNFPNYSLLFSY